MKIYNEINFKWDGEGYKEVSSVSEDYTGPMAMCARNPGFVIRETGRHTFYNESGQRIEFVSYKAKDNYEFSYSNRGHAVYIDGALYGVAGDGDLKAELGGASLGGQGSLDTIKNKLALSHGNQGLLMNESEYRAHVEQVKTEDKMKSEIQAAKITGAEALEAQGEVAELEASKIASESAKTLQDTLLATGLTEEEMSNLTSKAIEQTGNVESKIAATTQAGVSNLMNTLTGANLDAVKTGQDVKMNVNKLLSDIGLAKEKMATDLEIAKLGQTNWMDIISGMGGALTGAAVGNLDWKALMAALGLVGGGVGLGTGDVSAGMGDDIS